MRSSVLPAALLAVAAVAAPSLARAEAAPAPTPRSPGAATALAAAPVAAGIGLVVLADRIGSEELAVAAVGTLVVGPSLGHFYADAWGRGALTTGARAASLGLIVVGAFAGWEACDWGAAYDDPCHEEKREDEEDGKILMGIGAAAFVAATVYDIVDAPLAARRFNERFTVAPTMVSGAAGDAPGLVLSGRF